MKSKKELFNKLSALKIKDLEKLNLEKSEIEYIKQKLLNDKLGLKLNFTEIDEKLINNYMTLEEISELGINTKENEKNNLLIEGDNYYALKALQAAGTKVDIIYIDPPYNTGKEFIYNDDFSTKKFKNIDDKDDKGKVVTADDPHKHSKWLSFMKRRLELAKELLSDEGVIFVSIDDNEQAYLKVLMDEIFGENNFVISGMVENNPKGRKNGRFFANSSEYIVIYTRNKPIWAAGNMSFNGSVNPNKKILTDDDGRKYTRGKRQLIGKNTNPEPNGDNYERSFYIFINENTGEYEFINTYSTNGEIVNNPTPKIKFTRKYAPISSITGKYNNVTYTKEKMGRLIDENSLLFFDEFIYEKERKISSKFKNIFTKETTHGVDLKTETAGKILKSILAEKSFPNPKNHNFIKMIISLVPKLNATVLDFFAGSGTTAQAVIELNEEDGGNRRFILVTNNEMKDVDTNVNPEKGIARSITRERIFRVINGEGSEGEEIKWEYSKDKKSLKENSLAYLKVKHIDKRDGNFEDIDASKNLFKREFDKDLDIIDLRGQDRNE